MSKANKGHKNLHSNQQNEHTSDRDPPGQRPSLDRDPPWTETPQTETPPGQRPSCIVKSGRYVSYWNAFLYFIIYLPFINYSFKIKLKELFSKLLGGRQKDTHTTIRKIGNVINMANLNNLF